MLATGLRIVRIRQGKQLRPVVALLHRYIPFWLATINPKEVKPDVRPKLVRYQTELVDILAALYGNDLRRVPSTSADPTLAALQQSMAQALMELRLAREAILAFQQQQAQDTQLADHSERIDEQQRQLVRVESVVDDVLEQLAQHTTITTAQQEVIGRAIKRITARYQQRTGQEIFGQLFGTFCKQFNTPRYVLLSARRYQEALQWINDQARTLLPDDPEAALPLQESML